MQNFILNQQSNVLVCEVVLLAISTDKRLLLRLCEDVAQKFVGGGTIGQAKQRPSVDQSLLLLLVVVFLVVVVVIVLVPSVTF